MPDGDIFLALLFDLADPGVLQVELTSARADVAVTTALLEVTVEPVS